MIDTINEESTATLTLTFKDQNDNPITPETAKYRITNPQTGTTIREWTQFTPQDNTHTIQITSTDTQIINRDNEREKRIITIDWEGENVENTTKKVYYVKKIYALQKP